MTSEEPQWVRVHRQTFEEALREAEHEQQEMAALVARLQPGELRASWEQKLLVMDERLRRQKQAWKQALDAEG